MNDKRLGIFAKNVIPCVLSMASMALFTVVDGIFVSRGVGSAALAGINVVYPVVLLLTALSAMLALGVSTMIATRLAVGKKEEANRSLMSCIWFGAIAFALVGILSIAFSEQIAGMLGAEGEIKFHAAEYLRAYMYFAIPAGGITVLSAAVRNDNNPSLASLSTVVSSAFNIFGDWLFVFPLGMGVAGAAYATGISQTIGLLVLLYHFMRKKGDLQPDFRIRPRWRECRDILLRGAPECVNQLTSPVTTICFNLVIAKLMGDVGLETFAIISQPISIIIMLLLGVADGTQPLFSRSHSLKDHDSERYYFTKAIELNVLISIVVYAYFFFFGDTIFRIFTPDQNLIDMAMFGSKLYGISFVFTSIITVISCYFMSTLITKKAMVINISRTFVFNVIFIFATPYVLGKNMLWLGIVVSEVVVLLISIFLFIRSEKEYAKGELK